METINIISDEELSTAAVVLIERGSMSKQDVYQLRTALSERMKRNGYTNVVRIVFYLPGTEPPKLINDEAVESLLAAHLGEDS